MARYPVAAYRDGQRRAAATPQEDRLGGSQDRYPLVNRPRPQQRPANEDIPRGRPWNDYPDVPYAEPEVPNRQTPKRRMSPRTGGLPFRRLFPLHVKRLIDAWEILQGLLPPEPVGTHPAANPQIEGWTHQYHCTWTSVPPAIGGTDWMIGSAGTSAGFCVNGDPLSGRLPITDPVPGSWNNLRTYEQYSVTPRFRSVDGYSRSYAPPVTGPVTFAMPRQYMRPADWPYPTVDPNLLPIGRPAMVPRPLPWRYRNGRRTDPRQMPGRKWEATYGRIDLDGNPNARPAPYGVRVRIDSRGVIAVRPAPRPKPPPPRTREVKSWVMRAAGVPRAIYNGVSEADDLADSMIDALPKDLVKKYRRIWKNSAMWEVYKIGDETLTYKLWLIYKLSDHINIVDMLKNMADNEAEDRAFGRLGEHTRDANQQMGRPAGIALGPAL